MALTEDGTLNTAAQTAVDARRDAPVVALGESRTVATLAELLAAGAKVYNVKQWGAKGNGVADDTAAIKLAISKCFPSANNIGLGVLYFPVGTYIVTERLTIGYAGARYSNVAVFGDGRDVSRLYWQGGDVDGPLELLNCHKPYVGNLSIQGGNTTTNKALFALWFNVEDGKSGFAPRTDNVYLANASEGLKIGGGELLSSGQANCGLHTGLFTEACDAFVTVYGANTEVQIIQGWMFGTLLSGGDNSAIHTYNGRGIYIDGFDGTMPGGDCTLLHAEGGTLHDSGGFSIRNGRVERCWRLAYIEAGDDLASGASLNVVVDNVEQAEVAGGTTTDPCDVIDLRYQGVVTCRGLTWRQANSRIRVAGLISGRFATVILDGCALNNDSADPTDVVTMDTAGTSGTSGGLWTVTRGSWRLNGGDADAVATERIPDAIVHRTQTDVQGSTSTLVQRAGLARFDVPALGVGNSASATTLGTVTGKVEVFDNDGTSLGYVPVYGSIT